MSKVEVKAGGDATVTVSEDTVGRDKIVGRHEDESKPRKRSKKRPTDTVAALSGISQAVRGAVTVVKAWLQR